MRSRLRVKRPPRARGLFALPVALLVLTAAAAEAGAQPLVAIPATTASSAGTLPTATPVPTGAPTSETPSPSPAPPSPPRPATATITRLSNLQATSRWAYPLSEAIVRATPSNDAPAFGRLRFLTGDAQAELYVALVSDRLPSGAEWIEIELPGRPNGKQGWVPRSALGSLHVVHSYLLIDRAHLRATLFHDGRAVFGAPVGVGKASTATPPGNFYVMEKLTTLDAPVYGPYAIGTSAYAPTLSEWPGGGVVGIHGTDEPQLVPGRPSHGCIRLRNGDITRLWHMIELGTPIEIA